MLEYDPVSGPDIILQMEFVTEIKMLYNCIFALTDVFLRPACLTTSYYGDMSANVFLRTILAMKTTSTPMICEFESSRGPLRSS